MKSIFETIWLFSHARRTCGTTHFIRPCTILHATGFGLPPNFEDWCTYYIWTGWLQYGREAKFRLTIQKRKIDDRERKMSHLSCVFNILWKKRICQNLSMYSYWIKLLSGCLEGSFWNLTINWNSKQYKKKSPRRGEQFILIRIPTIWQNTL